MTNRNDEIVEQLRAVLDNCTLAVHGKEMVVCFDGNAEAVRLMDILEPLANGSLRVLTDTPEPTDPEGPAA